MIAATEIFCLNELGKRPNNEDCVSPEKGTATVKDRLFIVCDGVGGENKGEVASEIICTSIQTFIKKENLQAGTETETIKRAIQYANEKLVAHSAADREAKRMSTTLSLVLLGEQSVLSAWCGDTRIHHIRGGKIMWKSQDHSLVGELIRQGELTEEEARSHPKRNVITRSLNAFDANNEVEFHEINDFETGDYLLLCTDGFLEKVTQEVIYKVLMVEREKDKAKLFLAHCDGVTRDNFSMYLIKGKCFPGKRRASIPRIALILSILFLLIGVLIIVWFYAR